MTIPVTLQFCLLSFATLWTKRCPLSNMANRSTLLKSIYALSSRELVICSNTEPQLGPRIRIASRNPPHFQLVVEESIFDINPVYSINLGP
jgi:hypothetical protein